MHSRDRRQCGDPRECTMPFSACTYQPHLPPPGFRSRCQETTAISDGIETQLSVTSTRLFILLGGGIQNQGPRPTSRKTLYLLEVDLS